MCYGYSYISLNFIRARIVLTGARANGTLDQWISDAEPSPAECGSRDVKRSVFNT